MSLSKHFCPRCKESFARKANKDIHVKKHNCFDEYHMRHCSKCGKHLNFGQTDNDCNHKAIFEHCQTLPLYNHTNDGVYPTYQCLVCGFNFELKRSFIRHYKNNHENTTITKLATESALKTSSDSWILHKLVEENDGCHAFWQTPKKSIFLKIKAKSQTNMNNNQDNTLTTQKSTNTNKQKTKTKETNKTTKGKKKHNKSKSKKKSKKKTRNKRKRTHRKSTMNNGISHGVCYTYITII